MMKEESDGKERERKGVQKLLCEERELQRERETRE